MAALLRGGGHGYDLRKDILDLTGGEIDVDTGGLYRVLRRMEDEGAVVSTWVEGGTGPQRRDYELTDDGRAMARDWLRHLRERQRISGLLADILSAALDDGIDESRE